MEIINVLFFIIEIIGIVTFAVSGALTAIERKLDMFGVFVLAVVTATGGGVLRDIILGITPPSFLRDPTYIIIIFVTILILIIASKFIPKALETEKIAVFLLLINLFDALGLGLFAIIGVNTSIQAGFGDNVFLCVFVGVITGIGGGISRDVIVGRVPVVLRREIYAFAAILGCVLFYYLRIVAPQTIAMLVSASTIIIIRVTAILMKLSIPGVDLWSEGIMVKNNDKQNE